MKLPLQPSTPSLRSRLLVGTGVLTLGALLLAWWLIAGILERFVAQRFDAEKTAIAQAVMTGAGFDAWGRLAIEPRPADPRFERPGSAWSWQVSDSSAVLARSASLLSSDLGTDGRGPDAQGRELDRLALDFTAPGDGRELLVTVVMPAQEQIDAARAATRPLALALAVLGMVLLAGQWLGVGWGLRGVRALQVDLARLAAGQADSLPQPSVRELQPVGDEINRLIQANHRTVQRARGHVGNLAHALKTPLAVLRNRATAADVPLLDRMDRSVRWHLQRARAAGPVAPGLRRVSVQTVLDDLALVLRPQALRRDLRMDLSAEAGLQFAGELEDLTDMLGNLLDNALQWATTRVVLTAHRDGRDLWLDISDDGPGIPAHARQALLARGTRLDESVPGTGLGLAIVSDLVELYGGELKMEDGEPQASRSERKGLRVTITLPDHGRL